MPNENETQPLENRMFPNQAPSNTTPPEPGATPEASPPPPGWQEYVPDPAKSAEDNAAAKLEHDKGKPAAEPEAPVGIKAADIKLPEGFERDDAALGKFADILNNAELTPQARADALVALQAEVMKGVSERANQAFTDLQKQWQDEVMADPAIGGEKLDPALGQIAELINTYAEPAKLREMFITTGAGNNPHMIRFLHGLAQARSEGKPTPGGTPTPEKASVAERLYPSMNKG